ncbi:Nucleic acid-binding protein [Corchorus capsularis]|uniref:Nucleic acid-binding protein n=1 Tax=Corchorus capsularis TaxID=210143 RepID=A0A1R3G4N6_COCAP|nr:Nucleic acid-binding protein [Corchorus capsularis]
MLTGAGNVNKIKVKKQEQEVNKRTLELKLLSGDEVRVYIWAKFLGEIDVDMLMQQQPKPVMVIAGTTVKGSGANLFLTTTTGTKIYVNLDIPQTSELMERYAYEDTKDNQIQDQGNNHRHRYFQGWFYTSCSACVAPLQYAMDGFYCTVHKDQKPKLIAKLPLNVKEGSAKMELIIFGLLAEELANISVSGLPILQDNSEIKLPTSAYNIIGKEYHFVVGLPIQSIKKEELNFKIFDFKPVEAGRTSTHNVMGKAIEDASALLALPASIDNLALQTPQKPGPKGQGSSK